LPYNILNLIESDETLSTCQQFNAEVCYGSGLRYNVDESTKAVKQEVEDFLLGNTEEALDHMQKSKAIICVSDIANGYT
jgi:oligoribonuclease (3'-5' exoribonuclease)